MAGCTVTSTSYGYRLGGVGHDNTLVSSGKLRVKSLLFFPGTGADTAVITDKAGNAIMTIKGDATAGYETQIWVESTLDGMYVDLAATTDVLLVFIE
jgi:hypothetical protein